MTQEKKYIYDWPRPMVTVDAAVFTILDGKTKLLLIKRGNLPFKGKWALPGGFVGIDEELEHAVERELHEETGLTNVTLKQMQTFGTLDRDPRGRQITIVFTGIATEGFDTIKAGDDASEAAWFDVDNLPPDMAFDHNRIAKMAVEHLKTP